MRAHRMQSAIGKRMGLGAAACALLICGAGAAPQGGKFPIAATSGLESSLGVAFDGTNFLVGLNGDVNNPGAVGAQRVSTSGTLVGSYISTGRQGSAPAVAFGGGYYLLVWGDTAGNPNRQIYGQLIDTAGSLAGSSFAISASGSFDRRGGVAWDGNRFLVVYYREVNPTLNQSLVCSRFVTTAGFVGPEIVISNGFGHQGHNNVAFDGSNYLVGWIDRGNDYEVRGRFVDTNGFLGSEFSINASVEHSYNPMSVGFDGSRYLVVWADRMGPPTSLEWDLLGQLVSTTGAMVGGVISVTTAPGEQFLPMIANDAGSWLVTWTDMRNDGNGNWQCDSNEGTCLDVYGRVIGATGAWMGDEWPIITWPEDQFASPVACGGGLYLLAWCDGIINPSSPSGGDVYGVLLPSASLPRTYCTSKVNSQGCVPRVTFSGIPGASDPDPFDVGAVEVINNKNGILFYGFAPGNLPFQGGYLCVQPPIKRTPVQSSGGDPPPNDCTGTFSYDFNARIQSGVDPGLVPGASVYDQYWYRDPQSASTTGLTDAVGFDILP